MIQTAHIQQMLTEAARLARLIDGLTVAGSAHRPEPGWPVDGVTGAQILERAANLARHAVAELEDELLRERDGWGL